MFKEDTNDCHRVAMDCGIFNMAVDRLRYGNPYMQRIA